MCGPSFSILVRGCAHMGFEQFAEIGAVHKTDFLGDEGNGFVRRGQQQDGLMNPAGPNIFGDGEARCLFKQMSQVKRRQMQRAGHFVQ